MKKKFRSNRVKQVNCDKERFFNETCKEGRSKFRWSNVWCAVEVKNKENIHYCYVAISLFLFDFEHLKK